MNNRLTDSSTEALPAASSVQRDVQNEKAVGTLSRRGVLQATAAAGTLATTTLFSRTAHAAGSDIIKVGLLGCGGRGSGAASNAMGADSGARLTAIGDIFEPEAMRAKKTLSRALKDQYAVSDDQIFVGWDACERMLATDIDVILLCTPPGFRPAQMKASVEAGKHIFCEKPVAVDPVGVRSVMESSKKAAEKGLSLVSGLCWRYDLGVKATMERILDGAIGSIQTSQANYLASTLWLRDAAPDWTPMHVQVKNWLYYRWLSGDHYVEQFIHSLDKALWLRKDVPPVSCVGLGGRQVRTSPDYGDIYDHFYVVYEWADGSRTYAATRQMENCFNETEDYVYGVSGTAKLLAHEIQGANAWKYQYKGEGPQPNMYDLEHVALFNSIRNSKPINNGDYMCKSTLMAIMGREACYTGKTVTWEQAMNSQQDLVPKSLKWGEAPEVAVHSPGSYSFT
jgi:myo-inositol 2-dehydrogenase / D-chiro-inositol 1-dehydrogenase